MQNPSGQALRTDVAVVGVGPAGLATAIALAAAGIATVSLAPRAQAVDQRTTALLAGSVTALNMLGVWERCRQHSAPLRRVRLVDDAGGLLRAPEVLFDAREIGLDAFGHNVENRFLMAALEERASELPLFQRVEDAAEAIEAADDSVTVKRTAGPPLTAQLVVGADGR